MQRDKCHKPATKQTTMIKIEVIGNLGANAEVKTGAGNSFISFRLGHTDKFRDQNGNEVNETTWVSCAMKYAGHERLVPYLTTGKKLFVRGFLSTRVYTDNNHQQRVGLNCNVSELEICSSKKDDDNEQSKDKDTPF